MDEKRNGRVGKLVVGESSSMRILLTVHQFFPKYAAGTEVLTYSVARELIARGHEVRIFTAHPVEQELPDMDRFNVYEYERIPVYRFLHSYMPMAGQDSKVELSFDNHLAADFFKKALAEYRPDLVHFFHLNRLGCGLVEQAVNESLPAYYTPTDFWAICPTAQLVLCDGRPCSGPSMYAGNCVKHFAANTQKGVIGTLARWLPLVASEWLAKLTKAERMPPYPHRMEVQAIACRLSRTVAQLNRLSNIVSPNKFMTSKLVQYGVRPELITQSAFGVDVPGHAAPQRSAIRNPLRIGYIGTLAPHKGCHILIEAFNALPSGSAILKIYGNMQDFPEYILELRRFASRQENIEFCGVFHNSKIAEVMADIDVLVVPSLWFENTPLVLYSAQAARCPVIASDFPGISEVVKDQINGLLFEPGNSKALETQLRRLLGEAGLAEQLSANAQHPKSIAEYVDELLLIWQKKKIG
ncbi:MAG TPA: glycosyltransferase [Gallionella sp.]|nr:glycosyltransferase [Gallionella sp.]